MPQATAAPGHQAMKIYFCDGCNESIPLTDIQAGQVTTVKGKLFCRNCIPPSPAAALPPAPAARRGAGPITVAVLVALLGYLAWRDYPTLFGGARENAADGALDRNGSSRSAEILAADLTKVREVADELDRKLTFQRGDVDSLRAAAADAQRTIDQLREVIDGLQRGQAETGQLIEKLNLQDNRLHSLESRIDTLADMVTSQQKVIQLRPEQGAAAVEAAGPVVPGVDPTLQAELDALRRQLLDPDAGQRFAAVDRIAKGRYKQLSAELLPVLGDEDPFVRTLAMQALGDFGAVEAIPKLLDTLEDPSAIIRKTAAETLVRLTGYDPGFDPRGSDAERKKAVKKWREKLGG